VTVVLLNSGGKDSLAAAMLLREHALHSLYIHVGNSISDVEERVARKVADRYAVEHTTLRLSGGPFEAPSGLGPYSVMPAKAAALHAIGLVFAHSRGADALASGQRPDVLVPDFAARLEAVASMSRHREAMPLLFPVAHIGHGESDAILSIIGVEPLWRETIYCVQDPPCGTCGRCLKRKEWEAKWRS
jgi:7-cyano-7-deazaguanine synthase in queuosine biosynthesis